MNSRRTWGIDLTPLLDILFILLFMIMLRSVQYADAKVQEAEQRAKEAESRVQVVEEHLDKAYEVIGEYDILLKDTLTVRIEIQADTEEGEGARVLSFRAGSMSESTCRTPASRHAARIFEGRSAMRGSKHSRKSAGICMPSCTSPPSITPAAIA